MTENSKSPKVAILYIALGRYICFWRDFYLSCEKHLCNCQKHYFIWTDNKNFDFCKNKNVTVIHANKKGWPWDSLLRFEMFLQKKSDLEQFDYIYFLNANLEFIRNTDLAELVPEKWHCGIAAALHPGRWGGKFDGNADAFPYERRSESTACVPYGCGKHYFCGALNGGESKAFLKMCMVLSENVQTDIKNNINAVVDDESHLNAYLSDKECFILARSYLFSESQLKYLREYEKYMVKIISRHKDHPKYGGKRWLRGETDRKSPNNMFTRFMICVCRVVSCFVPGRKLRQNIRTYFGTL